MRPNYRMLSAALAFSILAAPVLADQKHDRKKHAKGGKHAVERTYLFHEMDDNHDGVISRREWRGNSVSFRQHDWNRNGVLSGEELRRGAEPGAVHTAARPAPARPAPTERTTSIRTERDEVLFARRDANHDGRITRDEWGDRSAFDRLDKNHDNVISAYEYGVGR
jgi:Ca2+-binding EF-hand superfamily protein